jgi:hypothetical protein
MYYDNDEIIMLLKNAIKMIMTDYKLTVVLNLKLNTK